MRRRGQVGGQLLALTDLVRRVADVDIPAKVAEAIRWSASGVLSTQEAAFGRLTDEQMLRRGPNEGSALISMTG
ncbi:hypothetical protein ILP97_05175 [Amycolatopsis sp. H6(2020)]|nr:hypothetical protein [Amycolatopsis sp. H6(2020)]